jgi:hypothetical protein
LLNTQSSDDRIDARLQEPCTGTEQHHHQDNRHQVQQQTKADMRLHGQDIAHEEQADLMQPCKRARLVAEPDAAGNGRPKRKAAVASQLQWQSLAGLAGGGKAGFVGAGEVMAVAAMAGHFQSARQLLQRRSSGNH